jgi:two-component system response regulator YesN
MEMTAYNCRLSPLNEVEHASGTNLLAKDYEQLIQKYKLLMGIINDGDFEELDTIIDNIFLEFRNLPVDQVKQISIDMFSMLSNKFVRMGIDFWKSMNKTVSYQEIMEAENLKDLKIKCKNMLRATIDIVKNKQNAGSKNIIEQSLSYIKNHVGEDISLEGIADRFFLNQTYFSRLFKQYTGSTFTDYLIEQRMEKAKELLSLGKFKVYEVSQMIGYRSEKYFFRVFKQYAGCSPAEYFRGRGLNDERESEK